MIRSRKKNHPILILPYGWNVAETPILLGEISSMTAIDNMYALPHLAAIWVSGLDAEKFLQSQLSSNVAVLEPKGVQLSSWCAANGRVIGLGWLSRTAEGFCWIVAADTAEAIIAGLNKYRLRAKVSITGGNDADTVAVGSESSLLGVQLADGRSLGFAKNAEFAAAPAHFLARWYQRDIELKIPWNGGGERFLPQMLGIERFAGLSLKKGCFPGQEVISRLHYKGVLKRSLRVLRFEPMVAQSGVAQSRVAQPILTGNYLCNDTSDEIVLIQTQGLSALAVVGDHLSRNFSVQRDALELFCCTDDAEFVATP